MKAMLTFWSILNLKPSVYFRSPACRMSVSEFWVRQPSCMTLAGTSACRNFESGSQRTLFASSEGRRGKAGAPREIAEAAARLALRAMNLVATDTEESYLANEERQLAIESLLIKFGEALKDLPKDQLDALDPELDWSGPKRFRDLAAHWYTDGLDHRLVWRAVKFDLPRCEAALRRFLGSAGAS